ncbi:alpha/beta hydrolase [Bacillus sp. HMF5848]|uniref:alpha/beta hydrolase family protein n=1 Tax=Bacillus sp. HMF5848 TaxID=2495421 RepID=UPI000F788E66|nr:alpha/beta fold hydrolase [Bacillus sp. HMF5848]RSK26041.1 alpha/beta hydrolase [Bacillus sp. HMF5848]
MKKSFFSSRWAVVLSLVIVLIGSMVAHNVQTDFGNVTVKDLRFAGNNGNVLSAKLFTPASMNPEEKLPAILTMHGYINSREVQDAFNIEFARRGYVVLAMDMQGHGYSEQEPIEAASRGAVAGLDYLRELGFVDQERIAVEGHSMGGWSTLAASNAFPEWIHTVIQVGSSTETYGAGEVTANSEFNYAIVFGKYDEFAKLMWEVPQAKQIVDTDKIKKVFGTESTVVPQQLYGSFEDQSARMLYIPTETHPSNHWSTESTTYVMDFMQQAMPAPNPIDPSNQTWMIKEFATLAAMIGSLMFLLSFGANLLRTNYFSALVRPIPEYKGYKSKGPWAIAAVIAAAIPALTYFPFQAWGTAWFPVSSFWPQSLTNGFVVWVLFNAIIAAVLFAVWHFVSNKKQGATAYNYGLSFSDKGLSLDFNKMIKAALLGIYTVGALFVLTLLADAMFLIDFRIWVMAFKPLDWPHFVIMLSYLLPFLVFFLANGALLHGQLRLKEGKSERQTAWTWFLANVAINTLGIIVLIAIQYAPLFLTEEMDVTKSLLSIVAFQFVFINFLVAMISTFFYRRTGTIYVGAIVNALLVTWYIVAGQAVQYAGQPASTASAVAVYIACGVVLLLPLVLTGKGKVTSKKGATVKG